MPKKIDKYYNERKEVFDKLLSIIGIDINKKTFYLHELDNNIDKQEKIMELVSDIKKYFICSRWTCFCKENVKRVYLSIIRYVIKDMKYNMISSRENIRKEDGTFIHATLYHIIKL
jgi:hypothetical protein